ncbi:hypothetical protein [Candidatus Coxiella mudrowiae]|uniref:hypothetical protein n=1 Tax=Candidatus Coxiella mudrowiae TaxID=2054173 RepID=UPI0006626D86|nr:hypothetical protein [Candidatus Coxiella mudrowiae]
MIRITKKIQAVTEEQVKATFAKFIHPKEMTVIVVGKKSTLNDLSFSLGKESKREWTKTLKRVLHPKKKVG